jgi:YidC/Oxa1 family membrane protein insertase
MDQKRFLTFIILSMGILIGWNAFVMPRFLPPKKPKAAQNQPANVAENAEAKNAAGRQRDLADRELAERGPAIGAGKPDGEGAGDEKNDETSPARDKAPADAEKPDVEKLADKPAAREVPKFPGKTVELGSDDPQTGFRQLVTLTSRGAAVDQIQLNDPRYRKLGKPHPPLVVVGDDGVVPHTLETAVPQLGPDDIRRLNWQLVELSPKEGPHSVAEFQLTIDDLKITKRFELPQVDQKLANPEAPAYALALSLSFENLGKKPRTVNYVLQGPTGLPLENVENTQKYRDVVVGFEKAPDRVDAQVMAAKKIAEKPEEWKEPIKYIGVDVQFFAALLCPVEDQLKEPYTRSATQQLIGPNRAEKSEISVELTSIDLALEGAGNADGKDAVMHTWHLFAGPKRDDVLPEGADRVIDYGTVLGLFSVGWISQKLVWLLKLFHSIFGSWGFAVICLTIVVRGAMFPISIKTARNAAKMQALKPELAALKEKYGNDKEKFARAQMELFQKHGHNPFAGCLPLFLQLPIFIGLYQALNHAVDLRLASFLWIDNLAAPDALFRMPFALPFLGQDFNLLPLVTTGLFYVQQKMFMPPPTNEQEEVQMKVMNFMMIFMGFMFYKVPAGLCVYFIASSLWGMAERKLLPKMKPAAVVEPPAGDPPSGRRKRPDDDDRGDTGGGGGGLWSMLLKASEKETSARRAPSGKRK